MTGKLFEKILITTDGSEKNNSAVEEGLSIARACGSQLYAIYVIDASLSGRAPTDMPIGDTYQMVENEAASALGRIQSKAGDLKVEIAAVEGKPAEEIIRFADLHKIDLIVIGTRGKRGLERLLLGSVAESVVRSAGCNVLVVK